MALEATRHVQTWPWRRTHGASYGSRMVFTDYWYLLALAVAAYWMVDPWHIPLELVPVLKHVPLMVTLPAVLLTLVGAQLYRVRSQPAPPPILGLMWPIVLLCVLITGGSLYGRLLQGRVDSFLPVGLTMTVCACAAAVLLRSRDFRALVRGYFAILLISGLYMSGEILWKFGVEPAYHEQEFVVIPLAIFCIMTKSQPLLRWLGFCFFLSMAYFGQKNTGFMVGLATLGYLLVFFLLPALRKYAWPQRSLLLCLVLLACVLAAAAIAFVAMNRERYHLPTGSPEFRVFTYALAWDKFLQSPIWGALFADPLTIKFTPFDTGLAGNHLPTHSDILDLLANGGMLGFLLWLYGIGRIAAFAYRHLLSTRLPQSEWSRYGHTLACMSLCAIVVYGFNPILSQPGKAYMVWTNLGFLVALALRNRGDAARAFEHRRAMHRATV
jgi:O-antigen ligase